jgi:hypothetical protein
VLKGSNQVRVVIAVRMQWNVNLPVESADASAESAEFGGTVMMPPFEMADFRNAAVADGQGGVCSISEPGV